MILTTESEEEIVVSKLTTPSSRWPPPLGNRALHGLLGDFVRATEPHTEADPAALLIEGLVAVGNAAGSKPHFCAEATRHGLNEYALIVGETSKARKSTTWNHVKRLLVGVDPAWAERAVRGGLSSGEGLIAAAASSADGRVLFVEEEFTAVIRKMKQHKNTLSATLRQGWDGDTLQISTRGDPILVKGAHISLLAHTTLDDLKRNLDTTEVFNGLVNRFLCGCARRSKLLPFGGMVPGKEIKALMRRLESCLKFAAGCGEIGFSEKAAKLWAETYSDVSTQYPGLVGAATSRAEAHARRIAAIYALLDESTEVRLEHLRAAFAVWRFCRDSAKFIFGGFQRMNARHENSADASTHDGGT